MKYFTVLCLTILLLILSIETSLSDVGIIVALNPNMEELKKNLKIKNISKKAGREFYSGKVDDTDVVLVRSPMGKVNNAITAQVLLSNYTVKSVISIAPAGAVNKGVNIGDIVVATEVYQHDFGTTKPYGFVWSRAPDGTNWNKLGYNKPDAKLTRLALRNANNKTSQNRIVEGVIVTGDQFISSEDKKDWLSKKFKAMAVEMGAAAIAQVCYANGIPFCILRIVTDKSRIEARTNFEKSIPAYQSDINIIELLKTILRGTQDKKQT